MALGVLAVPARAQQPPLDRSFSPQLFHPAVGPDEFLTVEPARPLAHLNYSVGLWVDYARDAFTLYDTDASGNITGTRATPVENLLSANLVGAIGLFDRFQIGLGLPMALYASGQDLTYGDPMAPSVQHAPSGFLLGDPWLDLKGRLVGRDAGPQLSVAAKVTFPASQANPDSYAGDSSVGVGGNVLAGWEAERWRVGLSAGFFWRAAPAVFLGSTVGSEVRYGLAAAYDLGANRIASLVGEVHGATGVEGNTTDVAANPLEADLAAKLHLAKNVFVTVGAGTGVHGGMGAPAARFFAGVTYAPDRRDRDHDGIPDVDDKCPTQPEDRDGFQDDDGCPDPDNDQDGIPDTLDKCPNEPEDKDGFQDDDGCPDPDNDKDGIPDVKDECPNDPEDHKPPRPDDGCPVEKTDTDGDGIPDYKDKCPNEPEDKDGFQDEDGCPDLDNDGDGLPDKDDKCPNEAEDYDQFEDEDGCPDPDNDHDGIWDADDKCPNEKETINGVKDDDGCPDSGPPGKVDIINGDVLLVDKVEFDPPQRATLARRSYNLLNQLALTLRAHPELGAVRIEGHTDDSGNKAADDALSQARADAVKAYLVGRGVDGKRLTAKGFGSSKPIAGNDTARGREANRRIEVHVVGAAQ